jgi:hypothetical protein
MFAAQDKLDGGAVKFNSKATPSGGVWREVNGSGLFLDQLAARTAHQLFDKVGRIHAPAEIGILHDGLLE